MEMSTLFNRALHAGKAKIRPVSRVPTDRLAAAIVNENKEEIREIFQQSTNLELLLQRELEPSRRYMNVFRGLLIHAPDIAEEVLDRLLRESGSCENGVHRLNYGFLDNVYLPEDDALNSESSTASVKKTGRVRPFTRNLQFLSEKHCLAYMVKHNQEALLKHPIVRSMLRHEWKLYQWLFYAGLFIWTVYIASVTVIISMKTHPYYYTSKLDAANILPDNCTIPGEGCCKEYVNVYEDWSDRRKDVHVFEKIIIFIIALNLLSEFLQILLHRLRYFTKIERLFTLFGNVLSAFLVADFKYITVPQACYPNDTIKHIINIHEVWRWEVSVVGVALSWTTLIFYVRKLPRTGIYIIMFLDLMKRFAAFSFILLMCLGCFGSIFLMLFPRSCPFQDLSWSTLSALVATVGEYSYQTLVCNPPGGLPETWLLQIAFAAIIFVMYLVVMNLMIGLAVDDIKEIQKKALFQKLRLKATVVLNYEVSIPFFALRRFIKFEETVTCKELGCDERHENQLIPTLDSEEDAVELHKRITELEKTVSGLESKITEQFEELKAMLFHSAMDFRGRKNTT